MNESQNRLAGIQDIMPPLPPAEDSTTLYILVTAAAILIVLLVAAIWHSRHSLRALARRRLARLQTDYQTQKSGRRYTVFQLAAIVRIGLCQQQLSVHTSLPAGIAGYRQRWNDFITMLDAARYASAECDETTLDSMFTEAEFWLRRWP
jgi:hypothetical protein